MSDKKKEEKKDSKKEDKKDSKKEEKKEKKDSKKDSKKEEKKEEEKKVEEEKKDEEKKEEEKKENDELNYLNNPEIENQNEEEEKKDEEIIIVEEELNDEEKQKKKEHESEMEKMSKEILSKRFFDKYRCTKKLGVGTYGMTYRGEYKNEYYALKFENRNNEITLLENEAAIMTHLKGENIPILKTYGYSGNLNVLVMQLLGNNLEEYLILRKRKFKLKTVLMLSNQMISILENIHKKSIIHRDIKPENFVMGLNEYSKYVYLINFGFAKKYRSISTKEQYPFNDNIIMTGTARYASINSMKGFEQSRRDDLESLGYVFIYFLKGFLPWMGLKAKNKEERFEKILNTKIEVSLSSLCKGCPKEFEKYLKYVKKLEFDEEPNYENYRNLFLNLMKKKKIKFDYVYDWTTEKEIKKRELYSKNTNYSYDDNHKKKPWIYKKKFTSDINGITFYKDKNNEGRKNNDSSCCTGCFM